MLADAPWFNPVTEVVDDCPDLGKAVLMGILIWLVVLAVRAIRESLRKRKGVQP